MFKILYSSCIFYIIFSTEYADLRKRHHISFFSVKRKKPPGQEGNIAEYILSGQGDTLSSEGIIDGFL